jgi:hypothetical protein
MTPADLPEFTRIVVAMAAQKPGKPLTEDGIELFWNSMRSWSIADFKAAAEHLVTSIEFMPNPFHFEQLRKAGRPTAGEAFAKARQLVRDAMARDLPSLSSGDPVLDSAMRACGGYNALAVATSENIGFLERRFAEHFESIQDATDVREAVPQIAAPSLRLGGPRSMAQLLPARTA